MPKRIIGQCHKSDFGELFHTVDLSNLTNHEKVAIRVIEHFGKQGIPLKTLDNIREVLVWDMGDGSVGFEYKLIDGRDLETVKVLRNHIAHRKL